jgi:hypothetical protein
MTRFSIDVDDCKNAVLRFDEVLNLKASKIETSHLEVLLKSKISDSEFEVLQF